MNSIFNFSYLGYVRMETSKNIINNIVEHPILFDFLFVAQPVLKIYLPSFENVKVFSLYKL